MNRIQKLLLYEYRDLDDTVLIESPFAQINEHGFGIRQVQLALTPTKIFIACDYVKVSHPQQIRHISKSLDPEIESLELSTVFPLEFISMSVFRKDCCQILKIKLCTKQTLLFEFGGFLLRSTHWNIWKDMIDSLRIHNNKLPCAVYLSQSSSNDSEDERIRQIEMQLQHSLTSISTTALLDVIMDNNDELSKESKTSIFRKISNLFSRKSAHSLPTSSITPDEKCKEYLRKINSVKLYGAVDLKEF